jgi:hypothetical protein
MWEMLCRDRDLQAKNAEKRRLGGTVDAEVNNVIYMELYSGPKMAHGKYGKNERCRVDRSRFRCRCFGLYQCTLT